LSGEPLMGSIQGGARMTLTPAAPGHRGVGAHVLQPGPYITHHIISYHIISHTTHHIMSYHTSSCVDATTRSSASRSRTSASTRSGPRARPPAQTRAPGRRRALDASCRESGLHGAFVWARAALNRPNLFWSMIHYYGKTLLVPVLLLVW
jgi:hypothetical protein